MKKSLFSISVATLLALTSIPAKAVDDNLVYVAVEPCRLVDTRKTSIMANGVERDFQVSGGNLSGQGGDSGGCLHPRAGTGVEPLAASTYIVAVPTGTTGAGYLTAFPSDQATPTSTSVATVNYAAGQVIGNTTNVTLCPGGCPAGGPLGLVSFASDQHVVIDVQGYFYPAAGSCSADMVAAGSVCVDKYEASLVDAGGSPTTAAACNFDGSNCGGVIFAESVSGVIPAANISWYQAVQACANVGKRLPTTAEWQMAAAGTPGGIGNGCHLDGAVGTDEARVTRSDEACVSTAGAFDMVGNLWEWAAELDPTGAGDSETTNNADARALGDSWASFLNASDGTTQALWVETIGPIDDSSRRGFRCAR